MSDTNNTMTSVFAIIRIDAFQLEGRKSLVDAEMWRNLVTVKGIVGTQVEAESEVQRLNAVNHDKGCMYFWQCTRLLDQTVRRGNAG